MNRFPTGAEVADYSPGRAPSGEALAGRTVRLERVDAGRDSAALFAASHGSSADPGQWTYMGYGPFADHELMRSWMQSVQELTDPLFMVVRDVPTSAPLGMVSFMNIVAEHRRLELGNIWYIPAAQRTSANTETIYLMLRESFEGLGYRRVEWKCDSLNARSKAAAIRLGFSFEGIFHQHYVVKGRNRDTAWFAMLDSDWPAIKANFETALSNPGAGVSLATLNRAYVKALPP